jgi:hypothetical protein
MLGRTAFLGVCERCDASAPGLEAPDGSRADTVGVKSGVALSRLPINVHFA